MIGVFSVSSAMRILITFLLGVCVLAQTLLVVLTFYRYSQTRFRFVDHLFEISILAEFFIISLVHGEVVNGYKHGIVVSTGYEEIRIIIFALVLGLGLGVCFLNKTFWPFVVLVASALSIPVVGNRLGRAFPWFLISGLLLFLARSIINCVFNLDALKTSISALSIIQAIDTLHTGILFCEDDGFTVLSNYQMQNLMIATTGKVFRNANQFFDVLLSDQFESRYKKAELDGQMVYILADGTAWMATKTEISFLRKNYTHVSVADVSKLWDLTVTLQIQNKELHEKSEKLKQTIANLHILSKQKEIEHARMRTHDILGQRLTVLLRVIQNESAPDYHLLTSLSKDLLTKLKEEQSEVGAYDEIYHIQQIFAAIGVAIAFEGKLPDNTQQAGLFVDIIRESSTNAVRHGFASQIHVKTELTEDEYTLTIKNNGHTAVAPITQGSGIQVMRKKVSDLGGRLYINQHPLFTLSVVLKNDA